MSSEIAAIEIVENQAVMRETTELSETSRVMQ